MGFLAFLFGMFLLICFFGLIGYMFIYLIHMFDSISHNYDWGTFDEMINKIIKTKKEYDRTRSIVKGYSYKDIHFQFNESQSLSQDYGWQDFFVCEKNVAYIVMRNDRYGVNVDKKYIVFSPVEYFKYLKWYYKQVLGSKREKGIWKE